MRQLMSTTLTAIVVTVSLFLGVAAVLSLAIGEPVLTVGLAAGAAATAWLAFHGARQTRP